MEVIDVTNTTEALISLSEAANYLPRKGNGKKISVQSLERWIRDGSKGVFLEGARIGNTYYTTKEAIQRFNVRCMNAASQRQAVPTLQAPTPVVTAAAKLARRELAKVGWGSTPQAQTESRKPPVDPTHD